MNKMNLSPGTQESPVGRQFVIQTVRLSCLCGRGEGTRHRNAPTRLCISSLPGDH